MSLLNAIYQCPSCGHTTDVPYYQCPDMNAPPETWECAKCRETAKFVKKRVPNYLTQEDHDRIFQPMNDDRAIEILNKTTFGFECHVKDFLKRLTEKELEALLWWKQYHPDEPVPSWEDGIPHQ